MVLEDRMIDGFLSRELIEITRIKRMNRALD